MLRLRSALVPLAGALVALIVPPARDAGAQSPREVIARAAAALGGEPALRALTSTSTEFNSANFGLGQEETPASPARATFFSGRIVSDYAGRRRFVTQETRPVTGSPIRVRLVMAGGIAFNENSGAQTPTGPAAVAAQERAMRIQPERLILAALDNPSSVRAIAPRPLRGELADGVRYANGPDTLSIYFDRSSGLPLATETVTDDPILGDRRTLTMFTRWQDAGGVKIARQTDVEVNGRLINHIVVTSAATNAALPDSLFVIPDSISARAQRGPAPPAPPVVVTLAELSPGVWRAEGGSHHSLVVEQPTQLVVVEAPQSSARMRAVLDTLRSRFPNKPVGRVVMSHHHWDHSGGVREAIASGIPIVAHRRNADFVRQLATARKTVAPDGLTRRPRAANVLTVADSLTIGTGESRLVLYRLPTSHAEGVLAAYVPASRLLFVVDVLSPGPGTLPALGSAEVAALVRARGITVDRLVGGHGGISPWADVQRAAGQ